MSEELKIEIQSAIDCMKASIEGTKDFKERWYYYGQIDGIIGTLEKLGLDTSFIKY